MKHFNLLLFILAAGLLMTSCKKEDNKKTSGNELMGTWTGEKIISLASINSVSVESDTSIITPPDYLTIEFKKDGKCAVVLYEDGELESANLYYKVEGDKITLDEDENFPDPEIHTFKISGKNLMLVTREKEVISSVTWEYSTEIHFKK